MKPATTVSDIVNGSDFGAGVPLGLGVLSILIFSWSLSGLREFGNLTDYGKLGVVIAVTVAVVAGIAAIYTYRGLDIGKYMTTRDDESGGDAE